MSDRFSVRYEHILVADVIGRLIRNAHYGGPRVALNGWCYRPSISNHTKVEFQKALNEDIEENGVRNPILVWSLPEGIFLTFGGSRVKACLQVGIARIPAIINDYTGDFKWSPEVTPDNWTSFFTDPPKEFEFGDDGADYHYNLERARRHLHDPAGFEWVKEGNDAFISKEFSWLTSD